MKKLLKTTYPCLIKTDIDTCELEENDTLEIEEERFLFVYPQNGNIPFYVDTKSEVENRFVSIIKHEDKTIFLLEKSANLKIEKKDQLNFSGSPCDIVISDKGISFETPLQKISYSFGHKSFNPQVFKYKNFACVQFENDFYAFDTKRNKLFHICGEDLQFENGKLSAIKKYHDSQGREKKITYRLDENVNLENETLQSDVDNARTELLPYKIMESVVAKDFAFISKNLSDSLRSKLDESQLKSFFGNPSGFLPLTTEEFIIFSSKCKNYVKFSLSENKIADISIDNL